MRRFSGIIVTDLGERRVGVGNAGGCHLDVPLLLCELKEIRQTWVSWGLLSVLSQGEDIYRFKKV